MRKHMYERFTFVANGIDAEWIDSDFNVALIEKIGRIGGEVNTLDNLLFRVSVQNALRAVNDKMWHGNLYLWWAGRSKACS
jgi:hypothetical protein